MSVLTTSERCFNSNEAFEARDGYELAFWWQVFLTAAGMIAFIDSILIGVFAGLLLAVFTLPLLVCTSVRVVTFLVGFGILQRYQ